MKGIYMRKSRSRGPLGLLMALALMAAACGGGGGAGTTIGTGTTTGPGATTGPTDAPVTTVADLGSTIAPGALGVITIAAGDPIKIASAQVVTGDAASLGQDQVTAIEIAVADRVEILGHPLELAFSEDEGCNAEGGQTAATRIMADPQVVGVIGTSCSGAGVPASKVISDAGRVLISGSNTSPILTAVAGEAGSAHQDGYFRTAHNDAIQGAAAATYVFDELGLTSVATINDGDPYTQGLTGAFGSSFTELGGEIVLDTAVTADQTDMRPVLTEVAAAGAELIFFPIFQPAGDFVAEQAGEVSGLEEVVLMGADGLLSDTYVTLPQTKGMYFSGPAVPEGDAYAEFVAKYEAAAGVKPIQAFHAHAYDAVMMLATAIENIAVDVDGSLTIDLQALRDELHAITYEGLTGSLKCDEFGDCADPKIQIFQNTDATADITAVKANILFTYDPA